MKIIIISLLSLIYSSITAQSQAELKVKWYSIEEAEKAQKVKPKKVFIDLYTDWCGWCKKLDASTFIHPVIVKYLNDNFYAVKLNAETKDTLVFNGTQFINLYALENKRAPHQLPTFFSGGRIGSYPTMLLLDERFNLIVAIPGFQQAKDLEPILSYISKNIYFSKPWETYQKEFVSEIKEE